MATTCESKCDKCRVLCSEPGKHDRHWHGHIRISPSTGDKLGECWWFDKTQPADPIIHAPWTDEQVAALNRYQHSGSGHPFTDKRYSDNSECILIATNSGWVRDEGGAIVQTWAWEFMTQDR